MKQATKGLRTWVVVNKKAVGENIKTFRSLIAKETRLLAVVKSNAYGHGLTDFAKVAEENKADWLAVDSIVEGIALRKAGIKIPILVLGFTLSDRMADAVRENISITVSNFETLTLLLNQTEEIPKIHLKIDTGMHRQGFQLSEFPSVVSLLNAKRSNLNANLEGLYTHFASAKNPAFPNYTKKQIIEFQEWSRALEEIGIKPIRHASATSAAILFPESHFDMVRIGIGLYGMWPSKEVKVWTEGKFNLEPVLSWQTVVGEVKELPAGSKIGYDLTEEFKDVGRMAVCPIGYWHGFPRVLSAIGHVLVKGKRAKVLGRVSMDMIVIDVTKIPEVGAGDVVTLIGKDGKEEILADEMANLADTVNYEIVTRINPLIKRIYV